MPKLPLMELDVLFVQEMGKNISGTGMDTNIIGRRPYGNIPGEAWQNYMPAILRIVVGGLTAESNGNATGIGIADFTTEHMRTQIDFGYTVLNTVTGLAPRASMLPPVFPDDRAALETAVDFLGRKTADLAQHLPGRLAVHAR